MTKKRAAGGGRKPLNPNEKTTKVAVTLLPSQVEAMIQLGNGNLSAGIRKAIDMSIYTNIDERYGEQVQATIADYQALNPDGQFVEVGGEIREILSDTPGDYEIVAIEQEIIDTQHEHDDLLDRTSKAMEQEWRNETAAEHRKEFE